MGRNVFFFFYSFLFISLILFLSFYPLVMSNGLYVIVLSVSITQVRTYGSVKASLPIRRPFNSLSAYTGKAAK